MLHAPALDDYLADMRASIDEVRRAGSPSAKVTVSY